MRSQCVVFGTFEDEYPRDDFNSKLWSAAGFSARLGEVLLVPGGNVPLLLTGLGARGDASASTVRLGGAAAARRLLHLDEATCDLGEVIIPGAEQESIRQAAAEGVHLGAYVFDSHKSHPRKMTKWEAEVGSESVWV